MSLRRIIVISLNYSLLQRSRDIQSLFYLWYYFFYFIFFYSFIYFIFIICFLRHYSISSLIVIVVIIVLLFGRRKPFLFFYNIICNLFSSFSMMSSHWFKISTLSLLLSDLYLILNLKKNSNSDQYIYLLFNSFVI